MSTRALVIRSVPYKEADIILTVLSDKLGRMTVTVRGASRRNSPLASAAQLFCCSDMVLYDNRGRYSLNEAQPVEQFLGLRSDIGSMALASYFAEVLGLEDELPEGTEVLRLALNALYALSEKKRSKALLKAAFELKYAAISGYQPQLYVCDGCGEELSQARAVAEKGELYCPKCAPPYGITLDAQAIFAARYITESDVKKMLAFDISEASAEALSEFSERYLRGCLDRGFKTLDFYYSLGDMK